MGRTALFLVLGLGMALGFIGLQMYRADEYAMETQYAYLKYMNARNLARASVHATLRKYDIPQIPATGVNTSFNGGTFRLDSLWTSANSDTIRMVTRGTYADSTYVMRVKLFRSTRPFPTVNGAISVRAAPVNLSVNAKASVDGHNYDSTGTNMIHTGDKPAVAVMNKTDSASVASAGGSNLAGTPAVKVDTSTVDPGKFVDIYKNNADYFYNSSGNVAGNNSWGSSSSPVIVYCNAGDDTSFSIKFVGHSTGYGILVVRGNVDFSGGLSWYGLVVVDGFNTVVSFSESGTPSIVGGIIIAGNAGANITLKGTGNAGKAVYSSQALDKAKNIGKLRYYTILDWYE